MPSGAGTDATGLTWPRITLNSMAGRLRGQASDRRPRGRSVPPVMMPRVAAAGCWPPRPAAEPN